MNMTRKRFALSCAAMAMLPTVVAEGAAGVVMEEEVHVGARNLLLWSMRKNLAIFDVPIEGIRSVSLKQTYDETTQDYRHTISFRIFLQFAPECDRIKVERTRDKANPGYGTISYGLGVKVNFNEASSATWAKRLAGYKSILHNGTPHPVEALMVDGKYVSPNRTSRYVSLNTHETGD